MVVLEFLTFQMVVVVGQAASVQEQALVLPPERPTQLLLVLVALRQQLAAIQHLALSLQMAAVTAMAVAALQLEVLVAVERAQDHLHPVLLVTHLAQVHRRVMLVGTEQPHLIMVVVAGAVHQP